MPSSLKSRLRELVPAGLQVPTKYWMDKVRGYVEPEMALLHHLFTKDDRVLDVGGNRGTYSYHCWKLGAAVDVFEPNPVCIRVLDAWAARKHRVNLHACALSDSVGVAHLHIPVDASGTEHDASASIEEHAFANSRDQPIPLRSLDSFGFSDAMFIKIDVEGHESKVIDGAAATLASSRPALLIEIEQRHLRRPIGDVFQQVQQHGYRGFYLEDGRLRAVASFELDHHQDLASFAHAGGIYINNFLFLHETRLQSGGYPSLEDLMDT